MEIISAFGSAILVAALLGAILVIAFLSYRLFSTLVTVNREARRALSHAKREAQLVEDLQEEGFARAEA